MERLCKRCVFATSHCSPEALFMVDRDGTCTDFRPFRVNCSRCGQEVVHGARQTLICLDCLVMALADNGLIHLNKKDKVRRNEQASHKQEETKGTQEWILD